MTDGNDTPREETAQTPNAGAAPPPSGGSESNEVQEGKAFAILSYALSLIGLPFFLVPLLIRNNDFALYHAKQCLMVWLAGIVGSLVSGILMMVCIGFIVAIAVCIFVVVLLIIGIANAAKGEMKPVPLIGAWGEDWFKGLQKA